MTMKPANPMEAWYKCTSTDIADSNTLISPS